ncbi:MAG: DUF3368 domain-containing protein [Bacteroidetes bacterium]|nr:DUF3368 domain-containing protein [Bacteroidota bacterium]MCB9043016.1 DUF3368 domain-containing protein [Chitinophagales bacterium]
MHKAKQIGLISTIKPLILNILATDFRISEKIITEILRINNIKIARKLCIGLGIIKCKYLLRNFGGINILRASSFSLLVQRKRSKRNDTFFKPFANTKTAR